MSGYGPALACRVRRRSPDAALSGLTRVYMLLSCQHECVDTAARRRYTGEQRCWRGEDFPVLLLSINYTDTANRVFQSYYG